MKIASLFFAVLAPLFCCSAQTVPAVSAVNHSFTLDVHVTSTGGESHAGNGANTNAFAHQAGQAVVENFSSHRDHESAIGLAADIRNLAQTADHATLEWYFFGKPVDKPEEFIFDNGSQEISLAGGGSVKVPVESKELKSHEEKHASVAKNAIGPGPHKSASVKKTGSKISGWLVRIVVDGKPAVVRGSSPSLEEAGRSDTRLAGFPKNTGK